MIMEITWITQGGLIFENSGHRLLIDPYLSDIVEKTLNWTRLAPAPIGVENLRPDTVFCSHNHLDHLDPVTIPQIAELYPSCHFLGPQSVSEGLSRMGVDPKRITVLESGIKVQREGLLLTAAPADHSDPYALGLVIQAHQKTVYVSCDTRYSPKMAEDILACSGGSIDFVIICINGKLNNMGVDEAVRLVGQLKPRVASPFHYGLFAENTIDPEPFADKCKEIGIVPYLFAAGKPVSLDNLLMTKLRDSSPDRA